jgi:hypothetical protein
LGDVAVVGVEHLAQQQRGALLRRHALEHREKRHRQIRGELGSLIGGRRGLGEHGLR